MIAGPPGIGKSALLSYVAASAGPAVFVAGAEGSSTSELALECCAALAHVVGRSFDGGADVSLDASVALMIDLSTSFTGLVVVDGLPTHEPEARGLLESLGAYAGTRFLVSGRASPPPLGRLAGQLRTLGPLEPGPMEELAALWAPEQPAYERSRAVRAARGNPGDLQRWLGGAARASAELSEPARRLLGLMALARQPLPDDLAAALGSRDAFEEVLRAGLLRRVGERFEAWSTADAPALVPELVARAATTLALRGGEVATLAAIALLVHVRAERRLAALLDERAEDLLAGGHASALWTALGSAAGAAIERWQLRCAARLGNATAIALTREPTTGRAEDRLVWAEALLAHGKPEEARDVSAALLADAELGARAARVHAEARARLGQAREGSAALVEACRHVGSLAVGHRIAQARLVAESSGDGSALLALLAEAAGLEGQLSPEDLLAIAAGLERADELRAALDALDLLERLDAFGPELLWAREALLLRSAIDIELGATRRAQEQIAPLRSLAREPSGMASPLAARELRLRAVLGRLEGIDTHIALAVERARPRDVVALERLLETRADLRRAEGHVPDEADQGSPAGAVWCARWDLESAPPARPGRRSAVRLSMTAAARALARDRRIDALAASQLACVEASRHGLAALELDALSLYAESLASSGDRAALLEVAGELSRRAHDLGSARYELHACFFTLVAAGPIDLAAAEELVSDARARAPAVGRWCGAILGGDVRLDLADRALLRALAEHGVLRAVARVGDDAGPASEGWGLDLAERAVWLPRGERRSLASKPTLWAVLETLARRPDLRADKETLAREVWSVEYHPLRHDGRLHAAISKLRALLEEEPSRPKRLLTTEDGYALGRPLRIAG